MFRILWRLTRGYRLRPWRSPYLRWRMETYWGLHAEQITFAEFWKFSWHQRRELLRYLKWAERWGRRFRLPRNSNSEAEAPAWAGTIPSSAAQRCSRPDR